MTEFVLATSAQIVVALIASQEPNMALEVFLADIAPKHVMVVNVFELNVEIMGVQD
jgi:hypothetical protein